MKKTTLLILLPLCATLFLAGCNSQQPLTEEQQAAQYNMTIEEYREVKQAAARMNMTIEEHMNMMDDEDHNMDDMDMDGMDM